MFGESDAAMPASALRILLEKLHGVADGEDRLGGVVRDLAPEFLLESHHELDRVEAVGAEVIDKAGLIRHLVGLHAQVLHDDLLHPLGNIPHRSTSAFQIGPQPRSDCSRRYGLVVVDGDETTSDRGLVSFPATSAIGRPSRAEFGYHTSIPLTSARAPCPA